MQSFRRNTQSIIPLRKKTGWLAQCFYLTPAQRIERLNEIYATDKFWENTPEDNRPQAKHK